MIDLMHSPLKGKRRKPKTNRKQARRDYLEVAKQKNLDIKSTAEQMGNN